jgi:hypothetical protein
LIKSHFCFIEAKKVRQKTKKHKDHSVLDLAGDFLGDLTGAPYFAGDLAGALYFAGDLV